MDPPAGQHQGPCRAKGTGKTISKQERRGERKMIATENAVENLTLNIQQEIHVKASLETTWEALLEELGPGQVTERGPMPMKLEAWPGARWYRDLGDNNGHW